MAREREERKEEKARENEERMSDVHRSARGNICGKRGEVNYVLMYRAI